MADTLRSIQYLESVDAVSEGPIGGLVSGAESIFFDETPLQNSDGTFNFTGVTLRSRTGENDQQPLPGQTGVEAETSVNVQVLKSTPITRSITDSNVDAVRVTLSTPGLFEQNTSNGDISGTRVEFIIYRQIDGGGFSPRAGGGFDGKTTGGYQRSYRIDGPSGDLPWDIRVTRVTDDSNRLTLQNDLYWGSYTEIIEAKLRYPNTAIVYTRIDAERFSSAPERAFDLYGMLVQIPDNYDPETREYSGVWGGNFITEWTDNPAWVYYDLLTNTRYGLGAFTGDNPPDKWQLYTIAQYCDELVDDGFGGHEPRFTCNLYLQKRAEAFDVVATLTSIFRAVPFWSAGGISVSQDSPADSGAIFSPANVIGGDFAYQGTGATRRHTIALVSWVDREDFGRQKIEYVEDRAGISRYGAIETEIVAVGCSSRGQAHRVGKWILITERLETEIIAFSTGLDAYLLAPGTIFSTFDPTRAGVRMSGRIVSATTSSVTVDSPISGGIGAGYTLTVVLPDLTTEVQPVDAGASTATVIVVTTPFTADPNDLAMWGLHAPAVNPELWRAVSVADAGDNQYEITGVRHDPNKYAEVEEGIILDPIPTSVIPSIPGPVEDLTVSESLFLVTKVVVGTRITISFSSSGAPRYEIRWRPPNGNWSSRETTQSSIDIEPISPGYWTVEVAGVNSFGRRGQRQQITTEIYGLTLPPADVTGFRISAITGHANLQFARSVDLDVLVGGHLRIRHAPAVLGATWAGAVDIGPALDGTSTNTVLPLLSGSYLAKWVDSTGNESVNATIIVTTAPSALSYNSVWVLTEHPGWLGGKSGVTVTDDDKLTLDSSVLVDDTGFVDDWVLVDAPEGVGSTGEYTHNVGFDLGVVATFRIRAEITADGVALADLIDLRGYVDTWESIDDTDISDVSATVYVRVTPDDPTGSPVWSEWEPFMIGEYVGRAGQFKTVLETENTLHNIEISTLSLFVDMLDRLESGEDLPSGSGLAVVYAQKFQTYPALAITGQDMQTGDYWTVTSKTATGFTVIFYDSGGSPVSRVFDWLVKGY